MSFKKFLKIKRRIFYLFFVIFFLFIGFLMNSISNVSYRESNTTFYSEMVKPKSSSQDWLDYNYYVALYGSAGDGDRIDWEFSGSNHYVGITVYAMDSSNYYDFRDGYSYSYYTCSDGSYYASSGNFYPSYTSTWYIVFINWDPDQESTYLTYSATIHEGNGGPSLGLIIGLAVGIPAVVAIVIVAIVVPRKKAKRKAELEQKPIVEPIVEKKQFIEEPVKPAEEKPPIISEPVKPAEEKPPIISEPVKPVKPKVVFCPTCGAKVEGTFCTQCGSEIERPPIDKEKIKQDIRKVFQVSGTRIDLDILRQILPMDDAEFNSKIYDLADRYNFKIELEILYLTEEKKEEFINALIETLDI